MPRWTSSRATRSWIADDDTGPQRYSGLADDAAVCAVLDRDIVAQLVRARERNTTMPISAEQTQHIAWVGPTHELPAEWTGPECERIPLREATVLPGLVDAHVHLAFVRGRGLAGRGDPGHHPHRGNPTIRTAMRQLLCVGVTTVRDLGAPPALRSRVLRTSLYH